MPRYVQQRDTFRCGPFAILNALKWAGSNATAQLLPGLCKELGCLSRDNGTYDPNLHQALLKMGKESFTVRRDTSTSLVKIEKRLRAGMAVIVSFAYDNKEGKRIAHYALIVGVSKTGKTFYGVNYFVKEIQPAKIPRRRFRNDLRPRIFFGGLCPTAWYLELK